MDKKILGTTNYFASSNIIIRNYLFPELRTLAKLPAKTGVLGAFWNFALLLVDCQKQIF